jgi:hypothetical protein
VALLALLQSLLDSANTVTTTNTSWRSAVSADQALKEEAEPVLVVLRAYLKVQYGKSSPALLKFGITPLVPTPKTVAKKMVGVARSAATRALRNPLTAKQKKELKGTVGPVIEVPTGEPKAAPAPAPAAAPGQTPHE